MTNGCAERGREENGVVLAHYLKGKETGGGGEGDV